MIAITTRSSMSVNARCFLASMSHLPSKKARP
jgi:hypothetical protein